jgi:hypothetical protein
MVPPLLVLWVVPRRGHQQTYRKRQLYVNSIRPKTFDDNIGGHCTTFYANKVLGEPVGFHYPVDGQSSTSLRSFVDEQSHVPAHNTNKGTSKFFQRLAKTQI